MKKVSWFFCLSMFMLVLFLAGCQGDEQTPVTPGDVRFSIKARGHTGQHNGRQAAALPAGASLRVSIADASGHAVYTLKSVALLALGDEYISEPLALPTGNYTLTEFLVVDTTGTVDFATPKEGAPLAPWVDDPLPAPFTVQGGSIVGLDVQVLAVDSHNASQFGYATFTVDVAPFPYFKLGVFVPDSSGLVPSPAQAFVLDGADTVFNALLPAGTNDIAFVGDLSHAYTLVLQQANYMRYSQSFVLDSLVNSLHGAPWTITLTPALTLVTFGGFGDGYFSVGLNGSYTPLTIDWGDGTIDTIRHVSGGLGHTYNDLRDYFVSVSGDLAHVEAMYLASPFAELHTDYLSGLTSINVWPGHEGIPPLSLDFSKNNALTSLDLGRVNARAINLPTNAAFYYINIEGNYHFSPASLNDMVDKVYAGAVAQNKQDGYFSLYNTGDEPGQAAPLTSQSLDKINELREVYGWTILTSIDQVPSGQ